MLLGGLAVRALSRAVLDAVVVNLIGCVGVACLLADFSFFINRDVHVMQRAARRKFHSNGVSAFRHLDAAKCDDALLAFGWVLHPFPLLSVPSDFADLDDTAALEDLFEGFF